MITYIIQLLIISFCFGFIYFNHRRISNIQFKNENLILDTKKKINALNTILLRKYEQKQNIDSKIMKIVVNRLNALSANLNSKDNDLQIEIDGLKRTLTYLQDQKTLFYDFNEESV